MDVRLDELDPELSEFASELGELQPSMLPRALAERFEAAIAAATTKAGIEDGKVVRFSLPSASDGASSDASGRGRGARSLWAAAAAVAALGAAAAFWVSPELPASTAKTDAKTDAPKLLIPSTAAKGNILPAGYGRNVREASDEGVVWSQDQVPHRRVRVEYVDRAVIINEKGERIEVERPRVEWLLVPEKMD